MNDDYRTPQDAPEVISTSQAVNLTSTIASLSALFALFFCFADQRSRAVRRFSVQSVGLGAKHRRALLTPSCAALRARRNRSSGPTARASRSSSSPSATACRNGSSTG